MSRDKPRGMPADHIGVLIGSIIMIVGGWTGLVILVQNSPPRLGAELWVFFVLLHIAVTGTVTPIVRYLNVRLSNFHRRVVLSCVKVSGLGCLLLFWLGSKFCACFLSRLDSS